MPQPMDPPPVIRAYYEAAAEALAAHGPLAVAFAQVGSFYEAYGFGGDGHDIHEIADVLRPIVVSRRDKGRPASAANPWFVGAPCNSFAKYASLLVDSGYTVVTLDQVQAPDGKVSPARRVSRVYSPGVPVECRGDSNVVMCVLFEETRVGAIASAATVDIVTGETACAQFAGMDGDRKLAIDGASAFARRTAPKETVLVGTRCDPVPTAFGLARREERLTSNQVEGIARLVFGDLPLVDARERLGLARRPGCFEALATALNFAWKRDETCIRGVELPEVLEEDAALDVQETSLRQLDVSAEGLIACVARPKTAAGRRLLLRRVTRPSADAREISARHDLVAERVSREDFDRARRELARCVDLDRFARRLARGAVTPDEWSAVVRTLGIGERECGASARTLLAAVTRSVDVDVCEATISRNVFVIGARPACDRLQEAFDEAFAVIARACDDLNSSAGAAGGDAIFRVSSAGETLSITTTARRFEKAMAGIRARDFRIGPVLVPGSALRTRRATPSSQTVAVYHDSIDQAIVRCLEARQDLVSAVEEEYRSFCADVSARFAGDLRRVSAACAETDVSCAAAKTAVECGHCRPEVVSGDRARLEAEDLRHPIVESQDREVPYVGNDVDTGSNMLLYGVNSSGKSCLMKSIGVAVILAQAGLYVPARRARIAPFRKIFTRIWSNDDIFAGKSTFVLEMTEFLDILRRACCDSLVLGDELCSGTEEGSAAGIVAQGLVELTRRGCAFVFATHMHGLVAMDDVAGLENLRVRHLAVRHDPATGKLVYDRRLAEGPGENAYGIEVLKGIGFPGDFVSGAYRFRRVAAGARDPDNVVAHRPSRYNARVNVVACHYCGAPADHAHHVDPQATAERHVKNRRFNLHPVCEKCHRKAHSSDGGDANANVFSEFRFTAV